MQALLHAQYIPSFCCHSTVHASPHDLPETIIFDANPYDADSEAKSNAAAQVAPPAPAVGDQVGEDTTTARAGNRKRSRSSTNVSAGATEGNKSLLETDTARSEQGATDVQDTNDPQVIARTCFGCMSGMG